MIQPRPARPASRSTCNPINQTKMISRRHDIRSSNSVALASLLHANGLAHSRNQITSLVIGILCPIDKPEPQHPRHVIDELHGHPLRDAHHSDHCPGAIVDSDTLLVFQKDVPEQHRIPLVIQAVGAQSILKPMYLRLGRVKVSLTVCFEDGEPEERGQDAERSEERAATEVTGLFIGSRLEQAVNCWGGREELDAW